MRDFVVIGYTIILCDKIKHIDVGFTNEEFSFLMITIDNNSNLRTPADTDVNTGKYLSDILGISQEEAVKIISNMRPPMPKTAEKKKKDGD